MNEMTSERQRKGRIRTVLLAGTAAVAIAGGSTLLTYNPSPAVAQETAGSTSTSTPFDFADVVEQVSPAVVSVRVESNGSVGQGPGGNPGMEEFFEGLPDDHPMRRFFREYGMPGSPGGGSEMQQRPRLGQGSGFFISEDGYVVTNNHVVESGDEIVVVMDDGEEYDASVVGTDPKTDLALLKVEAGDVEFPYVKFSEEEFRVGQWVVAVGNPFGLGGTVTAGIISASGREIGAGPYDDFIQIDAPVNRGNSGGPTFNLDGHVVGVNTAIFSPSGGNVGIAFAIPARVAIPVIEELKENGEVSRGWLGVQIQPVTEDIADSLGLDRARGAIVADILDSGPAGDSGIENGDIILSVNGQEVEDARNLARLIGDLDPDEDAELEIWRNGEVEALSVTLAQQPNEDQMASAQSRPGDTPDEEAATESLGLALAPASAVGADGGVAIVEVDPSGEGASKGLEAGQVILEANGQDVSSPRDVIAAVEAAREAGRGAVLFRVTDGQNQRFVALSLGRA